MSEGTVRLTVALALGDCLSEPGEPGLTEDPDCRDTSGISRSPVPKVLDERFGDDALIEDSEAHQTPINGLNPSAGTEPRNI